MAQYTDLIILFAGITLVFFTALFSKKSTIFITFILRILICSLIIYFANMGLQKTDIPAVVHINSISLLTSGILGFPGLLLLYGIKIYDLL